MLFTLCVELFAHTNHPQEDAMKLLVSLTCLALSCATEPPPTISTTSSLITTDPCQGKQWLEEHILDCGPGKFYCYPKVTQPKNANCRLMCQTHWYPISWVEGQEGDSYIRIRDDFTGDILLCLVRAK